jgi:hypothetical protein
MQFHQPIDTVDQRKRWVLATEPSTMPRVSAAGAKLLAFAAMLLMGPNLGLLLRARFWAEEATVYFDFAARHSFLRTICAPHLGYYALVPNAATALAAKVSLEHAPIVTTGIALLVQLIPAGLIAFSNATWLNTLEKRALAIVLVACAPPEVVLNTINSQFHVALAIFLIVSEDGIAPTRLGRLARHGIVVLGGLTGVVSCFLLPALALRAVRTRKQFHVVAASLLIACATLQLMIIATDPIGRANRHGLDAVISAAAILVVRTVVSPNVGPLKSFVLSQASTLHESLIGQLAFTAIAAVGIAVLLFMARRTQARDTVVAIALAYLSITILSIVGSLRSDDLLGPDGERYFYVPTTILRLCVLFRLRVSLTHALRLPSVRWLALALIVTSTMELSRFCAQSWGASGPGWRDEVAAFRRDGHALQVWPESFPQRLSVKSPSD